MLIHLHQLRDAGGLGGGLDIEAVGLHDGFVVLLVRLAEFGRHGYFVVEVGKAGVISMTWLLNAHNQIYATNHFPYIEEPVLSLNKGQLTLLASFFI